jgi:hypothetical protein
LKKITVLSTMKKYITLTIDVEPDCTPGWRYSDPLSFTGVEQGIGKKLHPLFLKYGIIPTYLINNVVLEDDKSIVVFKSLQGEFELGTHLHPEFIDPEKLYSNYAGKKGEANCCFYAPDIERKKIENITSLFENRFSYRPVSFRAGRFSAGANTISSLEKYGYKVDTSVTPHVIWNDKTRNQPVDFSNASEQPYFIKPGTILDQSREGRILQVPVSITTGKSSIWYELKRTRFGTRDSIRIQKPVWLRPVYSGYKEFVRLVEEYLKKYGHQEVVVFNMMFHNVEVMPKMSPYTKTEEDCKRYLHHLELFFRYCRENDIAGIKLGDVYELFRR